MAISHNASARNDISAKILSDIDLQSNAGKLKIKDNGNVVLVTLLLGSTPGTKPSGVVSGAILTFSNITLVNCSTAGIASQFDITDGSDNIIISGIVSQALNITNIVSNGQSEIRVTVTSHGYSTGDYIQISGVGGTTEANGVWKITNISANSFDLGGSVFSNTYTSGGFSSKGDITFTNTNFAIGDPIEITNGSLTYTAPI